MKICATICSALCALCSLCLAVLAVCCLFGVGS